MTVLFNPTNVPDKSVTWSSSDETVATVSNGVVTAVSKGSATITATSVTGGKTATCDVFVSAQEAAEAIDLGLSVKWASFNVGANAPEEYGEYYAWGELEPYYENGYAQENPQAHWKTGKSAGYDWTSYKWCGGSDTSFTKYCSGPERGTVVDYKTELDLEDDVARQEWGGKWRIPTNAEFEELLANSSKERVNQNQVFVGMRFTSTKTGYTDKSIFLPAAGYYMGIYGQGTCGRYWTSTLYPSNQFSPAGRDACDYFFLDDDDDMAAGPRRLGFSVRPVTE